MADVQAFCGVHYNWSRLDDPADVVAPPYDVIDTDLQKELYARHPANCIRLILNDRPLEGEGNRYETAREWFDKWLEDGTLVQDEQEALYVYHQRFEWGGQEHTRRGFMCKIRLHPYEERVVLPHEHTLRGPKVDRLKLNETVEANLSQVFLLYDDPESAADNAIESAIGNVPPTVETTTRDGIWHAVWTITDTETIATVRRVLANQQLLIADGHHRYETNLALRDRAIEREGKLEANDPRNFVLAYLANGADPGLLVLPTHRTVHDLERFDRDALLKLLADDFDVKHLQGVSAQQAHDRVAALIDTHFAFALVVPDSSDAWLISRDRSMPTLVPELAGPEAMKNLDLVILHEHILKKLLGMTDEDFTSKRYLGYVKGTAAVSRALEQGGIQAAFLVNHSPVSEVREICVAGGKMPQKSTFFYPKVLSGLLFHSHRR